MANSIEIFQFIQTYNQTIGIIPSQLNRFGYSINVKNVLFFIFILPYIVSLTAFLMFKVKAMLDIGISVFILISMVSTIFFYIIPMCQTEDTSMFIENCERFIAGSKYKRGKFILRFWGDATKNKRFLFMNSPIGLHSIAAYKELIEKIERLSEIFCYALLITLGFLMPPALLFTIVNYFIYDLKGESFYLLYPIMYVPKQKPKPKMLKMFTFTLFFF